VIRYQITDGAGGVLRTDVDYIQVRERHLEARELASFVRRAMTIGPPVLANDRLDVALACGAAGVHLRSGSIAPEFVRRLAPPGFLISVACHNADDVEQAQGADMVLLAPIFRPLSKVDSRGSLGLEELRRISRLSSVPVIALGGITEKNAAQCIEAGARGVAGISLFR